MGEGYRPWEIDRLSEEEAYRVYQSIKRKNRDRVIELRDLLKWHAWIGAHPWMKEESPIALGDFWQFTHELPPVEEILRQREEQQRIQDEWNKKAMDYMKRVGLVYG